MPLIILCGIPGSGKSRRSQEIEREFSELFRSKNMQVPVVVVSDSNDYSSSLAEKKTRGELIAAVERSVNDSTLVVVNSLNYIKGYRYQLYCAAKTQATRSCLLHCEENESVAKSNSKWDSKVFDDIVSRFEMPNPDAKWDKPYFSVLSTCPLPTLAIFDALFNAPKVVPNVSTATKPQESSDYLPKLSADTRGVIDAITDFLKTNEPSNFTYKGHVIRLQRKITTSELNRLQKQFMNLNKMRTIESSAITKAFIDYLALNLSEQ